MVRTRVAINYIIGAIFLLTFVASLRTTFDDVNRYGWYYNMTITIGADVTVEEVSITTHILGEVFLLIAGVMLIISGSEMSGNKTIHARSPTSSTSIEFIGDPPKHWDVWYDPRSHTVGVTLDDVGITFPLSMIEKWIKETLSEEDLSTTKNEEAT